MSRSSGTNPPGPVQGQGVGGEVFMGEHGAFGAAGGAGGVEDGGEVMPVAYGDGMVGCSRTGKRSQGAGVVGVQGKGVGYSGRGGGGRELVHRLGAGHQYPRGRVGEEVGDLARGVGGVEGDMNRAAAQTGEVEGEGAGGFLDLDEYPVPRHDALFFQYPLQTGGLVFEVPIAEGSALRCFKETAIEVAWKAGSEQGKEVVVHAGGSGMARLVLGDSRDGRGRAWGEGTKADEVAGFGSNTSIGIFCLRATMVFTRFLTHEKVFYYG